MGGGGGERNGRKAEAIRAPFQVFFDRVGDALEDPTHGVQISECLRTWMHGDGWKYFSTCRHELATAVPGKRGVPASRGSCLPGTAGVVSQRTLMVETYCERISPVAAPGCSRRRWRAERNDAVTAPASDVLARHSLKSPSCAAQWTRTAVSLRTIDV